jgi:LPXTG-motif cell wall-anchored protein
VDAVPAVDAVYEDREIPVTICKPVLEPTDPPLTPEEPAVETPPATEPEVIHEDDPRWDCATMGNKICGPVAAVVPTDPGTPAPPTETAVRTADAVPLASVGQPEELAYTGASDWVLPAGLGLLLAGGGLMVARRRLA